jgi:nitric oxide reductase activation protein
MSFFDYAWAALLQISRKDREKVKLHIRDNLKFPTLSYDDVGFVLCLVKPRRINDGLMVYQDMVLDYNNQFHRKLMWKLFKASTFHLSMHVAVSDYKTYDDWAKNKDVNLATFSASLVEDAVVNAYLRAKWQNLAQDIAYANAVSYLRMRSWSHVSNKTLLAMISAFTQYYVGRVKNKVPEDVKNDVNTIVSLAKEIEGFAFQKFQESNEASGEEVLLAIPKESRELRLNIATKIFDTLARYRKTADVPFMLHSESHGKNSILFSDTLPAEDDVNALLQSTSTELGFNCQEDVNVEEKEKELEGEIYQIFSAWEAKKNKEKRILESYKPLLENTNFQSIEFPQEDYIDFLRHRALLGGQIRRIMEKLRLLKNITGEDFKHESGLLDLQEAIQIVASKSRRTDIFVREELQTSEQAWAVLVDASHSLNLAITTVRGIALCLGEVAKNIIQDQRAWGMFAFNNKFYIIKDFSENYTISSHARIGGLSHSGMTYLPDGILMMSNMLRRRSEQSKILIVVSDFFPSGYNDIEQQLVKNVKRAEKLGVGVIGIGVKSRAVKNYFRFNCIVDTPYDLMKKFTKIFIQYSATA